MTEHAMPDAAPDTADLFEIIRTTRSMRRLKPDPVPNELIRKILEAGVCAPSGGNMQRWRFLVIRDSAIKETVGAYYKRACRTSGSSIYPAVQNMLLAARALGLGATLTTLYLQFEKEAEAALGLPPGFHSYALLPIGYPMGRFGPVRRIALADVVYEDRWGQPYAT